MTKKEALRNILICLWGIPLGFFIMFQVVWTQSAAMLIGVAAFMLVGYGFLMLTISIIRLLVSTDIGLSEFSDKEAFNNFAERIGRQTATRIEALATFLFFGLFFTAIYFFYKVMHQYETRQLEQYGQYQKVQINDIGKKGKGVRSAYFDYYVNEKKYSTSLSPKDFRVGDSVDIIYSSKDPGIVQWAIDFNKEN